MRRAVDDDACSLRRGQAPQIGQPVLVKVSYFPNWKASGAKGPYRVTPNLMVVIPRSRRRLPRSRPLAFARPILRSFPTERATR